jgi:phenylpropionate dioxygenase-like ring-hydroxylating dioxygenase large terminal subunit
VPYHQWSYARDGKLVACGGMDKDGDLDRRDFPCTAPTLARSAG